MTPRREPRTIVLATPHHVHGWTGLELELDGQWPVPVPGIVAPSSLEDRMRPGQCLGRCDAKRSGACRHDTLAVVLVDGDVVHVRVPARTNGRTRWVNVGTGPLRDPT